MAYKRIYGAPHIYYDQPSNGSDMWDQTVQEETLKTHLVLYFQGWVLNTFGTHGWPTSPPPLTTRSYRARRLHNCLYSIYYINRILILYLSLAVQHCSFHIEEFTKRSVFLYQKIAKSVWLFQITVWIYSRSTFARFTVILIPILNLFTPLLLWKHTIKIKNYKT